MSTSLQAGFEIILAVTVMSVLVCPMLLWVLPDRIHRPQNIG